MAVLGTPSVSLGEVGKTERKNMVTNIALSGRHHHPNPLGSQKGKVLSLVNSWVVRVWLLDIFKVIVSSFPSGR